METRNRLGAAAMGDLSDGEHINEVSKRSQTSGTEFKSVIAVITIKPIISFFVIVG
jgi:hypothetical protein